MVSKYKCDFCEKEFIKLNGMTSHRRWHNLPKYKEFQEKTKQKMSINHADFRKEKHPNYGKHLTLKCKNNMRKSHLGKLNPKQSETMKRLFAEGKLIPWAKGKTKENCESLNIISEKMKGEKNPSKRKEVMEKIRNKLKGKHLSPNTEFKKGENHPYFKGWKSREPYGEEFSPELREQIRQRDNYRCQQCFRHQDELRTKTNRKRKLIVHHIDFNKQNNNPNNLISLCINCHMQTNYNRENWTKYFNEKLKC